MDEHHQYDNSEHGSAQVYETTVQSDARGGDGREPRQDRDQGRVGTFDAKAEGPGKDADAQGGVQRAAPGRNPGRVGTFGAKAEVAGGRSVYAWQQQIAEFYGMRLRKNFKFGRRFAEVDGLAGLVGLQREYVSDMLNDYAANFWSFCGLVGFGLRGQRHTAERLDR